MVLKVQMVLKVKQEQVHKVQMVLKGKKENKVLKEQMVIQVFKVQ